MASYAMNNPVQPLRRFLALDPKIDLRVGHIQHVFEGRQGFVVQFCEFRKGEIAQYYVHLFRAAMAGAIEYSLDAAIVSWHEVAIRAGSLWTLRPYRMPLVETLSAAVI